MMTVNPRLSVLPRERAIEVSANAVSRAAWAVAILTLVVEAGVLTDNFVREDSIGAVWIPLSLIGVQLAATVAAGIRRSRLKHAVFLVVGVLTLTAFQISVLSVDSTLDAYSTFVLNRPAVAFLLVSPVITRPISGVVWAVVGYLLGMASLFVSFAFAGVAFAPGVGPTVSLFLCIAPYLAFVAMNAVGRRRLPDLKRLEEETRKAALEHEYEQRAAAVIHDTVLGDLTAIMNSSGAIDERMRERLQADVATLAGGAWLRESKEWFDTDDSDAELRNGMVALVSEFQWRGLTVDVTGNPENEVVRLSRDAIEATHAAVRVCLENVLQHAEVAAAELVLGASDGHVTAMVIDHGRGFDPAAVPADRLGLRQSVRARIERLGGTVRVWSKQGKGTSVLISLPADISLPTSVDAASPGQKQ
jgi:signal transduction histidine kinase